MTEKAPLQLSHWQRQALADMDIDAWYLKPLATKKNQADKAHDALVHQLLDSLTADSESSQPTQTMQPTPHNSSDNPSHHITPKPIKTEQAQTANRKTLSFQPPPAIQIKTTSVLAPPTEQVIDFSYNDFPESWQALYQAVEESAQASDKPCCHGIGEHDTDDLLVFPPLDNQPLDEQTADDKTLGLTPSERQLLTEMLASIGINWQHSYSTRVLKTPTPYGQDPEQKMLQTHLRLLAAELSLIKPKRIWLLGRLSCHAVMQTHAPLFELIKSHYLLRFKDEQNKLQQATLICLPSVDYLLALPAEKGKVWRLIQSIC